MRTAVVSLPDEAGVMAAVVLVASGSFTLSVLTGDRERLIPNAELAFGWLFPIRSLFDWYRDFNTLFESPAGVMNHIDFSSSWSRLEVHKLTSPGSTEALVIRVLPLAR